MIFSTFLINWVFTVNPMLQASFARVRTIEFDLWNNSTADHWCGNVALQWSHWCGNANTIFLDIFYTTHSMHWTSPYIQSRLFLKILQMSALTQFYKSQWSHSITNVSDPTILQMSAITLYKKFQWSQW